MKQIINYILVITYGILIIGCVTASNKKSEQARESASPQAIQVESKVSSEIQTSGQVVMVRSEFKFVVIDFGISSVPPQGQRMGVYRNNVKVGEVIIGWQREGSTVVADVIAGDVRVGDEVRGD